MDFLARKQSELAAITGKVRDAFATLSADAMDTKPGTDAWSINECLDHIVQSNSRYYAIFESVVSGNRPRNPWEGIPLLPRLWGSMILNSVSPDTKRKTRTFPVFMPAKSHYGKNLVADFESANRDLMGRLGGLKAVDLDRTIVTSPAGRFVVYPLQTCVEILVAHEHRHFLQAERVKRAISLA